MPIAFDQKTQAAVTTGNVSFTHTPVGTPTLAVVMFVLRDQNVTMSGATYGGTAMTLADRINDTTNWLTGEVWFLANPPSGARTVAATNVNAASCRPIATTWTGTSTDQATIRDQIAKVANATTVNITPTTNNQLIVGLLPSEDAAAPTTGAGETTIYNNDEGTWSNGSSYAIQTTATTQAINWTSSSACVIAVSFKEGAAPPPATTTGGTLSLMGVG